MLGINLAASRQVIWHVSCTLFTVCINFSLLSKVRKFLAADTYSSRCFGCWKEAVFAFTCWSHVSFCRNLLVNWHWSFSPRSLASLLKDSMSLTLVEMRLQDCSQTWSASRSGWIWGKAFHWGRCIILMSNLFGLDIREKFFSEAEQNRFLRAMVE